MDIEGTNINMIRGDSQVITVSCKDSNGIVIPFETGDTIYFTVKTSVYSEPKIMQKVITEFVDGNAIINIAPIDTKLLDFRCYYYDVQFSKTDGTVTTIIKPSKFNIEGEITYE